ncbi:type I restriction-modification system subunit M N-terminal domain-containing protein [Methylomonas sp. DH-1]|uniref:type I restriction-modification system subunit M N-terminal domain-containing protein n=1 Tax=Methylomonas sp. (strain DH-1) TaxID=1727196 RepID=UPI0007C91419|nr:type I restriction-modification system subunit M N-terminal domain-containing protein [Methylomonas sp. DH-1]ANE55641.1 hypothetical protein AYM39_10940 [Methylomonas sp. DH-1]
MLDDIKRTLWAAADKLRANMDAAEYKHLVLGPIFVKYISYSFNARMLGSMISRVQAALTVSPVRWPLGAAGRVAKCRKVQEVRERLEKSPFYKGGSQTHRQSRYSPFEKGYVRVNS